MNFTYLLWNIELLVCFLYTQTAHFFFLLSSVENVHHPLTQKWKYMVGMDGGHSRRLT